MTFVSLSNLGVATPAPVSAAAPATGPADAPDTTDAMEEITVTAEKITKDLQKTALSITVITADALDQANIASPKDLNSTAPGLLANSTPSNPLALSIRGAGYQGIENNSAQPGVSFNQNGVYISSPTSLNANFLDVSQIEVLRGPQGTVLGQNSDGGAINVTTVRPVQGALSGNAEASGGTYGYDRVRFAVNLPLGDTLAVRIAFQQERHDGYTKADGVPGQPSYQLGNENSYNGRVDALWKPTDALTVELWGEFYTNNANGEAFKNIYDPNPDPYRVTQDFPSKVRSASDIGAANIAYQFDWATARLITSYQRGKLDAPEDLDKLDFANGIKVFGVHDIDEINSRAGHSKTEEFDLTSNPGGNIDWIAGVFAIQQAYDETVLEYQYTNPNAVLPPSVADPGAVFATGALAFESIDTQRLNSTSLYGQGTYHFSDRLRFTAGLRGTKNEQEGLVAVFFNPAVDLKADFRALTGKAVLEYDVAAHSTVYGMWSSGIKPGGTNLNPGATVVPTVFAPEKNGAFELGSKNQFLDEKLRLNMATFYNHYKDFQVDSEDPIPFKGGQTNINDVRTYGFETEMTALLPYYFRIDANATLMGGKVESHQQLLDPEVAQLINKNDGGAFAGNDLTDRFNAFYAPSSQIYGKTPPEIPSFAANVGIGQGMHLGNGAILTSHIKYSFRNTYFFRVYDNPATDAVPALRQWDLDFDYLFPSKNAHVDFLIKNLTDTASVLSRYTDNFGVGAVSNYYVPPRLFILRAGVSF
jgi:iron complex outermembrane receptor protein